MLALGLGSPLTSASTITPTHDVHHVIYSANDIETIVPPSPDFCGMLILISDDDNVSNLSVGNPPSGNIAAGVGLAPKRMLVLVHDPDTAKWYIQAT
jgi:hypothetical protein